MILSSIFKLAATCNSSNLVIPGIFDGLCDSTGENVQLSSLSDIYVLLGNLIEIVIWLAGSLSVVFIVVGGIMYVVSAGDPAKVKRAKDTIFNAVMGLIIVLISYSVVVFISSMF